MEEKVKLILEVEDTRGPGELLALFKIARHVVVDFGHPDFLTITRAEFVHHDGRTEQATDVVRNGLTFAEVFGHER